MSYSQQLVEQINDLFEADIIDRGKRLQQNNGVTSLHVEGSISACVNDLDEGGCNTFIQINAQAETLSVDGECSCEEEFNCAHVVATLLQYIDTESLTLPQSQQTVISAQQTVQNSQPDKQSDKQLHFVLSRPDNHLQLQLYVLSAERISPFIMPLSLSHPARFIQPADLLLLQMIQQQSRLSDGSIFALSHASESLMCGLIESTRCHWLDTTNPKLKAGRTIAGKWLWHQHIDGSQQLMIKPQDDVVVLPILPLRYLDQQRQCCGLIDSGLTAERNRQLFSLPTFQAQEIPSALESAELKKLLAHLPQPLQARDHLTRQHAPKAIVDISLSAKKSTQGRLLSMSAEISFEYPGGCVKHHDPTDFIGEFDKDTFIRWQRDTKQETALVNQWRELSWVVHDGAEQMHESWQLSHDLNGLFVARFIAFELPQLVRQGWRIQSDEAFPQVLTANEWLINTDFTEVRSHSQCRIRMMLSPPVNDSKSQPVNLLLAVSLALQSGWIDPSNLPINGQSLLSTEDQRLVIIDDRDLMRILDCLIELNARHALDEEGFLLLSRARLQAVQGLLQALTIKQGERDSLDTELEKVDSDSRQPEAFSDNQKNGLKAQLRPYQQQGVDWLHQLHQHRLGGLLADDMGLGKTLQILTFLWQCKCRGTLGKPVLILAPTSLLGNWKSEAQRFTPGLKLRVLHGPKRAQHFPHLDQVDLVITSYPLIIRDIQYLLKLDWKMLILDEAQAIKNADSRSAKAVREFNAGMNICLSGTPIENHLGELWALFDFMLPGLLGGKRQFKDWFQTPIQQHNNSSRQELLIQRIAAVMLRRDKQTVLPQLPPKIHQLCSIELTDEQRQIYQDIENQMRQRVRDSIQQRGIEASRMHILNALTRLRQVCCDPRLLPEMNLTSAQQSAKLNRLLEMLDEMLEQGRRVLLFSQFTSLLSLVETELKNRSIDYALLTGQTRKRDEQIKRFQQGEVALFLISLKAGGSGLNLTQADTVIHYDPWWNPAVENQATDRAHRIGQYRSVMVYKLIAADTIEQKIVEMQQDKQLLADNLLQGASQQTQNMSSSDLTTLLRLLEI